MTNTAILAMVAEVEEQRNFALRRCAELRAQLAESEEVRRAQAAEITALKAAARTEAEVVPESTA